jgi:hypothetical protein
VRQNSANRQNIVIVLAFASALVLATLPAQDAKPVIKPPAAEEELSLGRPGPEHEILARYSGVWEIEIRMVSSNAPIMYQGAATNRMTAGGRFLQIEYQAVGKTNITEGIFSIGFDQRHQRFTVIAIDSLGSYFVTSRGVRDEKTGKIRLLGTDDDPMIKPAGYTKEFVHVLDLRSPNNFIIEIWFIDTRTAARKELKFMDYTFKRKK